MKRMKKLLAFLLAAMLLLSMIPISASAASPAVFDTFTMEYAAGGSMDITVMLHYPGDTLALQYDVHDLDYGSNQVKITLTGETAEKYDIAYGTYDGSASVLGADASIDQWTCQLATSYGVTFHIYLCEERNYEGDIIDTANGTILYKLYEHQLLKLLKTHGVEVDKDTEIDDVEVDFVNEYTSSDDYEFAPVESAGNNLPYWWTRLSDANDRGNPNNINSIYISSTSGGARIPVSDLLFVNENTNNTYSVESTNTDLAVVAFYKQTGANTGVWDLWDIHFTDKGNSFEPDHTVPADPTYGGNITFVNWDHGKDGGDPFLPYEDIDDDTVLYGQVVAAGENGVLFYHVMNTDGSLYSRYIELFKATNPTATGDDSVVIETISVSDGNISTNPYYEHIMGWQKTDYFIVNNNQTAQGSGFPNQENNHVSVKNAKYVTIYGSVGGNPFTAEVPIGDEPGDFSLGNIDTAGGGGAGIAVELTVNPKPEVPGTDDWDDPDDEDADDLYAQTGVVVDCTNKPAGHTDGNYELENTNGTMKWSADEEAYVYEIEVEPGAYVDKYNEDNEGTTHTLSPDDQSGTIVLVFRDGKWSAVDDKGTVTFTVTCEDEQGGGDPGKPDEPTDEDIAAALEDIIAVTCEQTGKHDESERFKTFDATEKNATITKADAVGGNAENGYTYKVTVSLTNDQRDAFIKEFDHTGEHTFKNYDPENGKLEVTLKYLPASQAEPDKGYTWALSGSSDLLTIKVTCGEDTGDDDDEKPTPPTHEELENLLGNEVVTVECINEKTPEHGEKKYGLLEGSYYVDLDEDGNTCTIIIRAGDYIVEYNEYINKPDLPHGLTSEANKTETIELTLGADGKWALADGEDRTVTFEVKCGSKIIHVTDPGEDKWYPVYVDPEDPTDPDQTGVSELLETDDHIQYLFGYPDGSFGPDRNMTRAEAAQMFYNLLKNQNVDAEPAFDDVPEGAWYATPVNVMAELGIVDGVGDDKFEPNREITRAEFTTMAMRFAKVPSGGVNIFTDVAPSDWFYSYVVNSIQYGWIEGYGDGTFRPDRLITRAEVTTIVNRMLDRQADMAFVIQNRDKLTKFTDLTTEHWAYYTIVEATNEHNYKKPAIGEDWTSLKK